MLIVKNLSKNFNTITAVNDLSFEVQEGKIFGLLGPNGAGKTTTIRMILNIIKPTTGEITFSGKLINENFFNMVGYLPEERGLYKKSRVVDVLIYFGRLKNLSKSHAFNEGIKWLKSLSLLEFKDKKIQELSKGNQQKVQFILSVIHNPKLLILDEPFGGLDPINQQVVKELILSFIDEGKIILLSTHYMDTAEKLCSDILLMDKGRTILKGSLSEIKQKFGGNYIRIQFKGNPELIRSIPFIKEFEQYNNYSEVQIDERVKPHEFLRLISSDLEISHFSVIEPTLDRIFIDAVKKST
jgi:ABC-2 type transport system ATP-binding protein